MRIRTMSAASALAGAVMLIAGAAYAGDPMVNTYGNTVVSKDDATGVMSKLLFNKDGTFSAQTEGKDGKAVDYKGAWTLKDDGKTICVKADTPPDAKETFKATCSPLQAHNVGDSWKITNDQQQTFDVSIVAGH